MNLDSDDFLYDLVYETDDETSDETPVTAEPDPPYDPWEPEGGPDRRRDPLRP